MKKTKLGTNTNLIRGGLNRSQFNETSEALFLTSGFVYDSAEQAEAIFKGTKKGFQYTRYSNPTVETFEKRLALLDGSEDCFATASGMAAVFFSLMCQLKAGDHLVSSSALFGSCKEIVKNILPRYGIEVTFIDGKNINEWRKAIKRNTKIFFFETPSNPLLELIDVKAVCNIAKKHKIKTVVDNIFASPVLQKPVLLGADIIVYSGTKHIDGQDLRRKYGDCKLPETSIPKPYFCQCKVDIDQSHHIMRRLRSHSPSLSLPSLRLSLTLTLSPGSVKRNRQPARGFRCTASGAQLSARGFLRTTSGALLPARARLPARGFRSTCVRACVRVYGGFAPCPASW